MSRKIATLEKILEVKPHPNADRLDLVKVLGYQCVTQKDLHREGDLIVFIQPDSVLPEADWSESFRKFSPKRVKAAKLRGEWSEGIILSYASACQAACDLAEATSNYDCFQRLEIGDDVSESLGVTHYEPPLPKDLSAKGTLPFGIPKTDEERWENLADTELALGALADVTLKVDGQSFTAYYNRKTDTFGICGRTLEFKDGVHNDYTANAKKYDLENKLRGYCTQFGVSLAIRGESYGQGIQAFEKNPHAKLPKDLAIFSVFDIEAHEYCRKGSTNYFLNVAKDLGLPTVPVLERDVFVTKELIQKYSTGIDKIDGKPFEGVVIQHTAYELPPYEVETSAGPKVIHESRKAGSFKVINKSYDSNK